MSRSFQLFVSSLVLCGLLSAPPAGAQHRHRAPPAKGKKKGHRRPAPEPSMPVRKSPVVSSFVPQNGPPRSIVLIKGDNFDATTKVRFNGRWLKIVQRSKKTLEVRLHPRAVTDHFVIHKAGFPDLSTSKPFNVIRPPKIHNFKPRRGGPGTRIKIFGQHFLPDDVFVVGNVELQTRRIKPHRARVIIPAGAVSGKIGVKRSGRVIARSRGPFDVIGAPPIVTDFQPTQGPRGEVVKINGKNFEGTDWVELNRKRVPIRNRSHKHIDVQIGNHTSGRFLIRGRHGRHAFSAGTFSVLRPPVVRRFFPPFGPPGTRVTLLGAAFAPGDQVYVGRAMLTIRTQTENKIVAELPAGVSSGRVFVKRAQRSFFARGRFEVIHPPVITDIEPKMAPPKAVIKIAGRNFLPGTRVLLAGRSMRVVRRRLPNEVEVEVPPNGRTGQIVVVTRGGSVKTPFAFRVAQFAQISSFFPLHAPPKANVTIRGTHFHKGVKVFFLRSALPIERQTARMIQVAIPEHLKGKTARFRLESYGRSIESRLPFRVDVPKPPVEFTFHPETARRGGEVTLFLTPPRPNITVFYNGRPLPKKVLAGGRRIVITIPGDGRSGFFEIEFNEKRYRAKKRLRVR
jgi:hypothetical protein